MSVEWRRGEAAPRRSLQSARWARGESKGLSSPPGTPYIHAVPDLSSELMDAKVAAAEARTDAKFADLRGDIRELSAKTIGKATFFTTILAAVGVIIAVLAYAGQWFGLGLQSHDALVAAAKEGAAQALKASGH